MPCRLFLRRNSFRQILAILLIVTAPQFSAAQRLHPYVTAGTHGDYGGTFFGVTGGTVYDLIGSRISAGAELDVLLSPPYAAARGGPVGQFNFLRNSKFRPFAIGGYKWGEAEGVVAGGGVEYRPNRRFGFRGSLADVFQHVSPDCVPVYGCFGYSHYVHAVSLQFGVTFR